MQLLSKQEPGFYRYLWKLSLPIILQNLITFSLGLMDTFMVSQLGNDEMAAVTCANLPVFMLISLVFGVQSGLGILISQYWGKKDLRSISRAIGVASMVGAAVAAILSVVLFLFPVQVMDLLSNKHHLSVLGAPYLKLIGISYVFNIVSSVYASAQRSVENPNFGMKLFGTSTVINTFLNYLLIFGKLGLPQLGIQGAAIATLCARICEFIICLIYALRDKHIPMQWDAFLRPGWEMLRRFLKYASPVVLNETIWGLGNSLLIVIIGHTEKSVQMLAANSVMGNLCRLFLVVCFGLGAATAVMVGKAIGEGKIQKDILTLSHTLLRFALLVSMVLAALALVLIPLLFEPFVFPLFKLKGEAVGMATAFAVGAFATIPLHAYSISAITGVLRSGGDVVWSTCCDILPQWLFCLPLTALCALVLKTGVWPIAIAIQTESFVKIPLCIFRIRSGKWIRDVTVSHKEE